MTYMVANTSVQRKEETNSKELVGTEFKNRGKTHHEHIRNNLLNGLEAGLGALRSCNAKYKSNLIKVVEKSFSLLILYQELMSKYPEFRKGELESERGYFPDIPDSGIERGIENYIFESERRLNGRT